MCRKKPRVANVRVRRPLKRTWPPNRQVLLESFFDRTLRVPANDQSPTKRICDRRAALAVTSQTACLIMTSKNRQVELGHSDSFDPNLGTGAGEEGQGKKDSKAGQAMG